MTGPGGVLAELVRLRRAGRFSQAVVAESVGMTRPRLSLLENGRIDPKLTVLQRYARAVGARLEWTADVVPPPDEPPPEAELDAARAGAQPGVGRPAVRPRPGNSNVSRAAYLSPPDFHRLNWACVPIRETFGSPPYLVGSVLARQDFRDIDLRLILPDERVAALDGGDRLVRRLLNVALSGLITSTAGRQPAPIDFQIQSMTEAAEETGMRNPMGLVER